MHDCVEACRALAGGLGIVDRNRSWRAGRDAASAGPPAMIEGPELWLVIVGMGVTTIVTRSAFLLLPKSWQPRGRVAIALGFVPMLAIVGIVAPAALHAAGLLIAALWNELIGAQQAAPAPILAMSLQILADARLPSALVVLAVGAWRRNPLQALIAGVGVFLLLRMAMPGVF